MKLKLGIVLLLGVSWGWLSPAHGQNTRPTTRPLPPKAKKQTSSHSLRQQKKTGLWKIVQEYWSPKLQFVWKANKDYWTPRARFVLKANRDYWSRKALALWKANEDFWPAKVRFVMDSNKRYWLPKVEYLYLPWVRTRYKRLQKKYGDAVSKSYKELFQTFSPMVTKYPVYWFQSTWKRFPASFRKAVKQVPAPVKKTLDKYHSWSLKHLHKHSRKLQKHAPHQIKSTLYHLTQSMVPSRDKLLNARVTRAFRRIRNHAEDTSMHDCYRVKVLDSPVVNAFNTGCSTYITTTLVKKLTDEELAAVLAHEISHGDQGHAVKNLLLLSKTIGEHTFRLLSDELTWFLTGRWSKRLQKIVEHGHVTPLLDSFGKKAPAIELQADRGAVRILKKAGISPKHLISVLMKLHGKKPGQLLKKNTKTIDGLRDYPSLYKRVQAVKQEWKKK